MPKIKTLFLVALTFFLFAASYRPLAVGPAHAQSGTTLDLGEADMSHLGLFYTGVIGRTVYTASGGQVDQPLNYFYAYPPVPGTSRIIAATWFLAGNPVVVAMLENGDVYTVSGGTTDWSSVGNIVSGAPTGVQRETWGRLKARYAR